MPELIKSSDDEIVKFLRNRDYVLVRELGKGACGRTVLLHDDQIDEDFVCKKYEPAPGLDREALYRNFVREIKLLYKMHHENVVRVFNHYLYPEKQRGYILMEFVDGPDISKYVSQNPEKTNRVFQQAVAGFAYLESRDILHRDIRPWNVLVRDDGTVKIIDLGFGKQVTESGDFHKSISLNWWCATPAEFADGRYDFATEVYFVGKLFEMLIADNQVSHFKYTAVLDRMCQYDPSQRTQSFADVRKEIGSERTPEIAFSDQELDVYRAFTDEICNAISRIENGVKYDDDTSRILRNLDRAYLSFRLEVEVPDASKVVFAFIVGTFYRDDEARVTVVCVREFLFLFESSSEEKRRIILANIHTRLDNLPRYSPAVGDDIPF